LINKTFNKLIILFCNKVRRVQDRQSDPKNQNTTITLLFVCCNGLSFYQSLLLIHHLREFWVLRNFLVSCKRHILVGNFDYVSTSSMLHKKCPGCGGNGWKVCLISLVAADEDFPTDPNSPNCKYWCMCVRSVFLSFL
jgi:hypothetical protein